MNTPETGSAEAAGERTRTPPLAGAGGTRRHMVEARAAELETAQALKRVIPPGAVIDPITDRLAKLAVARDVDPERLLMAHDILHRPAQCLLKRALVGRLNRFA